PDGTEAPFATIDGTALFDGMTFATVRSGNTAGFRTGDVFVPVGVFDNPLAQPAQIARITDNGHTVVTNWLTVTDAHSMFTELYVDRTGVFNDDLLALTALGELWQIDPYGNATRVASGITTPHLQGDGYFITVPDDQATYGPLSGKAVIVYDVLPMAQTVVAAGNVAQLQVTAFDNAEGLALVPPAANFFAVNDGDTKVSVASGVQLAPIVGQIVVAPETDG